jgi:hypothetical protein
MNFTCISFVRVGTGPDQLKWLNRPVFTGLKNYFDSKIYPVVTLRVESKNKFLNFPDKQFFIIKYVQSKFKFFYQNNGVVSKSISLFSSVCLFLISLIGLNFVS